MEATTSILLHNGTVITRGERDSIVSLTDNSVLIEGNKISKIAPCLGAPSASTEVIDCTGKIISPGFVDTHNHVWQTQLKGRHANHTLMEYVPTGW